MNRSRNEERKKPEARKDFSETKEKKKKRSKKFKEPSRKEKLVNGRLYGEAVLVGEGEKRERREECVDAVDGKGGEGRKKRF